MSDLYVDPFYWEFGYAVGDQDLQALEADPVITSTSVTGGLGVVQRLSALLLPGEGALLNAAELNTAAPAEPAGQGPVATISGSLDVQRFMLVSGGFSVEASCSGALGVTVNLVAPIQTAAETAAALDLQVPLTVDASCAATTSAGLRVAVNLHAGLTTSATVAPAAVAVTKLFAAATDSAVHTSAIALLGKRLAGGISVSAAVSAAAAIQKAMNSSVGTLAVTAATAQIGKPLQVSASGTATAAATAAVGKPLNSSVVALAAIIGRTVLLRFVPAEIADRASVEVVYSVLYADAELVEGGLEVEEAYVFAEVVDPSVALTVSYTEIYADAELIDQPELEVSW